MSKNNQILVWDLFVRVFHWSLVLFFFTAYLSGDDTEWFHRYVGYAVFGLVAVRIVWGFCGTKHALFSDFICPPTKALSYLKEILSQKPKYYTGHNPAAAWMIILLLALSLMTCVSGYAAFIAKGKKATFESGNLFSIVKNVYADDEEHEKHDNSDKEDNESESIWEDLHEMLAQLMLVFVCFHIIGVVVSSKLHNENLIKSMITGRKNPHSS